MTKVRALAPVEVQVLPERDGNTPIPRILYGLLMTVRCLEQAHELLNHARFEGDNHARNEEAREVLHGLAKLRDSFAGKFEKHPLYPQNFVRHELAEPGVARLRAMQEAH